MTYLTIKAAFGAKYLYNKITDSVENCSSCDINISGEDIRICDYCEFFFCDNCFGDTSGFEFGDDWICKTCDEINIEGTLDSSYSDTD